MEERRGAYRIFAGNSEGRGHVEDLRVDGEIIVKWGFMIQGGGHRLD
jgi:hypothetical protein